MNFFKNFIIIGVKFPKENVRFPKKWNKIKKSIYKNEDNYMVLTGKVNNIIVIDLDHKDQDFKSYKWFKDNLTNIRNINTLVTKTINNGYHIYFKYTDKLKNTNNREFHIDILSDNKGAFQGKGYSVINKSEIRSLTNEEISKLQELKVMTK